MRYMPGFAAPPAGCGVFAAPPSRAPRALPALLHPPPSWPGWSRWESASASPPATYRTRIPFSGFHLLILCFARLV